MVICFIHHQLNHFIPTVSALSFSSSLVLKINWLVILRLLRYSLQHLHTNLCCMGKAFGTHELDIGPWNGQNGTGAIWSPWNDSKWMGTITYSAVWWDDRVGWQKRDQMFLPETSNGKRTMHHYSVSDTYILGKRNTELCKQESKLLPCDNKFGC